VGKRPSISRRGEGCGHAGGNLGKTLDAYYLLKKEGQQKDFFGKSKSSRCGHLGKKRFNPWAKFLAARWAEPRRAQRGKNEVSSKKKSPEQDHILRKRTLVDKKNRAKQVAN